DARKYVETGWNELLLISHVAAGRTPREAAEASAVVYNDRAREFFQALIDHGVLVPVRRKDVGLAIKWPGDSPPPAPSETSTGSAPHIESEQIEQPETAAPRYLRLDVQGGLWLATPHRLQYQRVVIRLESLPGRATADELTCEVAGG